MLGDSSFILYLLLGMVALLARYQFSFGWGVSLVSGMCAGWIFQWFYNRGVSMRWKQIIENKYTISKEYGFRTISIDHHDATNTKSYHLEKTIPIEGNQYSTEVVITIHLSFYGVRIIYHPAAFDLTRKEQVSIQSSLNGSFTAFDLMAIEKNALGKSSYVPDLR